MSLIDQSYGVHQGFAQPGAEPLASLKATAYLGRLPLHHGLSGFLYALFPDI